MKWFALMLCLVPALALADDAKPEVLAAKIATGVKDREAEGEGASFKADAGKLYCWTKVKGPEGSKITHAWYKGDQEMSKVELTLKHATMRTWSFKTITPDMKGDWRVDILGPDGAVLQSVKFTIEG